jgi:hypothetical protein
VAEESKRQMNDREVYYKSHLTLNVPFERRRTKISALNIGVSCYLIYSYSEKTQDIIFVSLSEADL